MAVAVFLGRPYKCRLEVFLLKLLKFDGLSESHVVDWFLQKSF